MKYIFYDFPLTPSANGLYATYNNRRIKTKKYNEFLMRFDVWRMKNRKALKAAADYFGDKLGDNWTQVNMYICVNHKTAFNLKGGVKALDASNRVKACHDALARAIDIDDKHFSIGITEKVLTKGKESIIIELELTPIKKLEELDL